MNKYFIYVILFILMAGISFAQDDLKGSIPLHRDDKPHYPDMATITFEQALDIALKHIPGKLLDIELDDEDGYLAYDIELVNSSKEIIEIIVDPLSGKILRSGVEKADTNQEDKFDNPPADTPIKPGSIKLENFDETKYPDLAKISFKEAQTIAQRKVPGKLLKMELDHESGYLIYEILIVTDDFLIKEIIVDPVTGDILRISIENEDKYEDSTTN